MGLRVCQLKSVTDISKMLSVGNSQNIKISIFKLKCLVAVVLYKLLCFYDLDA